MRFGRKSIIIDNISKSATCSYCTRREELTFWQGCRLSSPQFSVHSTFLKTEISEHIMSLSSPVIGVLIWLIHDRLKDKLSLLVHVGVDARGRDCAFVALAQANIDEHAHMLDSTRN